MSELPVDRATSSAPPPVTQDPYTPQFRASGSLILRRLASTRMSELADDASDGSAAEDSHDGMADGPMTLPMPKGKGSSPASGCTSRTGSFEEHVAAAAAAASSSAAGLKRKRGEVPDFTQNTISFPAATTTTESTAGADKIAAAKNGSLECARRHTSSSAVRPAKMDLVGFRAGYASDAARSEYFMRKRRVDLLNILSYCDQVRPGLLPDILVSVSKKHPDLRIFDAPDWQTALPTGSLKALTTSATPTTVTTTGVVAATTSPKKPLGRPRHGHTAINPKARIRHHKSSSSSGGGGGATKKALLILHPAQQQQQQQQQPDAVLAGSGGEDEKPFIVEAATLPPTWPKAGAGMYATLPRESEDAALLTDDKDGASFSQFLVGALGKPVVLAACA
ncbi:hypothetical protein AAL_04360 [Moelleriella libera RCEF 2490]|uniref:Uncharacterized protein n=1 Tax=Moelleriella libera RCEF 2490 TaxID=1081109 RepID=A0A168C2I6_9HYPO|nr:hypothetical protein AAL_04360 [Moelleriella libera RCEF 2490]